MLVGAKTWVALGAEVESNAAGLPVTETGALLGVVSVGGGVSHVGGCGGTAVEVDRGQCLVS